MKKRIINITHLVFVISILFLVVSCGPKPNAGDSPLSTEAALRAARTGTQGVEISLLPNYPPSLLYD